VTEIRWENPPSTRGGRYTDWNALLLPLMEQPNRWAIIATRPTSMSAQSAAGGLRAKRSKMPPGRWEFAARQVDGEHRIYARYLGPHEDGA